MRSFISSFRPLPGGWRALAIAVVFAGVALVGIELLWRARGVQPSLNDDATLWCRTRATVAPDALVIVGSSRVQTGIDPQLLAAQLHRPVVQLAVAGSNPLPALLGLARDPGFHGTLVAEYMPRRWLTADVAATGRMQAFLTACDDPSLVAGLEATLADALQARLSLRDQEVQLMQLLSYVAHHRHLPHGNHSVLRADRYMEVRYAADDEGGADIWDPPLPTDVLATRLGEVREAVAALRARGGRFLLYRAPVGGAILDDEEHRYPAAQWFPDLAKQLEVDKLDFREIAALRDLRLPDGEHPDVHDVPAATDALAGGLQARFGAR